MDKPNIDLSLETLETQLRRESYCARATIPAKHFRALLNLAMRVKAFDISGLRRLENVVDGEEVELSGKEIKLLLMLAIEAKRRHLRPRLRVVPTKHLAPNPPIVLPRLLTP